VSMLCDCRKFGAGSTPAAKWPATDSSRSCVQDAKYQPGEFFSGVQQTYFPCRSGNRVREPS